MLYFKSFDIKNDVEISAFLQEFSKNIVANGMHYHDGRICFTYFDKIEERDHEAELKETILKYLDAKIDEYTNMVIDSDALVIYWRALARKGNTKAPRMVLDTIEQRDNQRIQIDAFKAMKEEVKNGKWNTNDSIIYQVSEEAKTTEAKS